MHDADLKRFYDSLALIGKFLKELPATSFLERILKLPLTVEKVWLIKDYTIKALRENSYFYSRRVGSRFVKGVNYLRELIAQGQFPSPALEEATAEALAALLMDDNFQDINEAVLMELLLSLRPDSPNLASHFKLIKEISHKTHESRFTRSLEAAQKKERITGKLLEILQSKKPLIKEIYTVGFDLLSRLARIGHLLTIEDIQLLWRCSNCHEELLLFLRRSYHKLPHERITKKELPIVLARNVVTLVFMNQQLLNLVEITMSEYLAADELILSCNCALDLVSIIYT